MKYLRINRYFENWKIVKTTYSIYENSTITFITKSKFYKYLKNFEYKIYYVSYLKEIKIRNYGLWED